MFRRKLSVGDRVLCRDYVEPQSGLLMSFTECGRYALIHFENAGIGKIWVGVRSLVRVDHKVSSIFGRWWPRVVRS